MLQAQRVDQERREAATRYNHLELHSAGSRLELVAICVAPQQGRYIGGGAFQGQLPGVCQGRTIVEGTRIGVHDVVGLIVNGIAVDDVLRSFPDLTRAQVYECLAFYEDHRTEIDALVAEQMAEAGA